jgi:hypothetical protein
MSKDLSIAYSSGKIIILWRLIFFASKNPSISVQELSALIESSGVLGGTTPFADALQIGRICKLLKVDKSKVLLSEDSASLLLPMCPSQDPNISVVRFMLQRIIQGSLYGFQWLLFFNKDVEIFKVSIPEEWIDLLEQAELLNFGENDVDQWWDTILSSVNNFDAVNTKEIGDVGEKLTITHENIRLKSYGIRNPQHYVKWASRFSNGYGFDVLSVEGKRWSKRKFDRSTIQVEVKASVSTNVNSFRFRISRNEWNVALENIDTYYFYCWLGINVDQQSAMKGPYVIPAKRFIKIVPKDRNNDCEWSECRLTIDLTNYSLPEK